MIKLTGRTLRRAFYGLSTACLLAFVFDCGDASMPPQKSPGVLKITVAPAATGLDTPIDATPDPMGTRIYFIASSGGGKAVLSVPASGGTPALLYSGAPLVDPRGISVSSDGKTLYIADRAAGSSGGGAILSMPSAGDTPQEVAGSDGTHPTALDLAEMGSSDDIYFTGADPQTGAPAVFQLAAAGGTATELATGAPLVKPNGIAIATDLSVYVADEQAGKTQPGQVFVLDGGKATALGPELDPGDPTGIAVTLDDSTVLVSSLDPKALTSEVTLIQVKTGQASTYNDVINANKVSGGLHRARFKDTYAWAGKTQVYSIGIHRILSDSSTIGGVGNN